MTQSVSREDDAIGIDDDGLTAIPLGSSGSDGLLTGSVATLNHAATSGCPAGDKRTTSLSAIARCGARKPARRY